MKHVFRILASMVCMFINHIPFTFFFGLPFGTYIKQRLLFYFVLPWYNCTGWLGVKKNNQATTIVHCDYIFKSYKCRINGTLVLPWTVL